jgi:hypothetical protein
VERRALLGQRHVKTGETALVLRRGDTGGSYAGARDAAAGRGAARTSGGIGGGSGAGLGGEERASLSGDGLPYIFANHSRRVEWDHTCGMCCSFQLYASEGPLRGP